MNREEEVAALMRADVQLMSILVGGVYADGELGVEGIRREDEFPTSAAFDDDGILLPCAVVRQRAMVPTYDIYDMDEKHVSINQIVEVHFHQFRGHDAVDAAKDRNFFVLLNQRLTGSYPLVCEMETSYYYDVGPVKNSTTLRQDWLVTDIRKP